MTWLRWLMLFILILFKMVGIIDDPEPIGSLCFLDAPFLNSYCVE